jgi:hypothetical protein
MIEDDGLKAMGQVIQMKPGSGINFGEMVRERLKRPSLDAEADKPRGAIGATA